MLSRANKTTDNELMHAIYFQTFKSYVAILDKSFI